MATNGHGKEPVFLLFGKSGWIGGLVGEELTKQGVRFEYATARLEDRSAIVADIDRVRCSSVLRGICAELLRVAHRCYFCFWSSVFLNR